jgi:hypothetical protein
MMCYEMAVSKGLSLTWSIEPSLPPMLFLDSTRLQQILLNLTSNVREACISAPPSARNLRPRSPFFSLIFIPSVAVRACVQAIKFTKSGGSVELFVSGRLLSSALASSASSSSSSSSSAVSKFELEFRVRDTGIGIKSENLAGLFRSFHQVHNHVSGEFGGTGTATLTHAAQNGENIGSLHALLLTLSSHHLVCSLTQVWAWSVLPFIPLPFRSSLCFDGLHSSCALWLRLWVCVCCCR